MPTHSTKLDPVPLGSNAATGEADRLAQLKFEGTIRYQLFCEVWAIATLFHMAQSRIYTNELCYVLLTLAAIALIIKPGSVIRLSLLITLQLYEVVARLPEISNHWIFTTFVNLTILQALFYLIIKKKSLYVDRDEFIQTFAPVVRIELLLLYFFVVLHKLNWGFFSTDYSCAGVLYKAQNVDALLPTTSTFLVFNIYLTIIIELLIPAMLFFRKTRNMGLLIGLVFHCVIAFNSFNGFYDFSGMIFAAYFLFTGYAFSNTVYSAYKNILKKRHQLKERFSQLNLRSFALLVVFVVVGLALLLVISKKFNDYFRVIWGVYSFLFIILFLRSLSQKSQLHPSAGFRLPTVGFALFPVLVFLNGICPYLGLKTESSFAMFSNLRTENGLTNHFFIPTSAQVFDYQKDMIEIVSSSDLKLRKLADEQKLIPFFQFKNYVAKFRPAQVEYIRAGEHHTFDLAAAPANDELLHRSSIILRKLLGFRAITKTEPQPCQH